MQTYLSVLLESQCRDSVIQLPFHPLVVVRICCLTLSMYECGVRTNFHRYDLSPSSNQVKSGHRWYHKNQILMNIIQKLVQESWAVY